MAAKNLKGRLKRKGLKIKFVSRLAGVNKNIASLVLSGKYLHPVTLEKLRRVIESDSTQFPQTAFFKRPKTKYQ
ncbi:MAG: hypothetical protein LBK76_08695 [Verrucomicrobiales bacterium]|jgi:transcriptional regulator with XRE-family HTH domain|nr:hypothetical protein [Verrucomicrobiales bacterium]